MDKLEVDKRQIYFSLLILNNYLRKTMEKLLRENEEIEKTFLEVSRVAVKKFLEN